ncbi:MAG: universal stress protein [Promethearchaeota archaeon]
MYKKILLATDGSDHIDRAASIVIGFYKKWGCEIRIFHSIKHTLEKVERPTLRLYLPYSDSGYLDLPSSPPVYSGNLNPNNQLREFEVEKIGRNILDEKKAIFEELHIPVKTKLVVKEDPEYYIIRLVKKKNFDLVVVGYKGIHSKLSQLFLGSVAQYVVEHSPCDVLVIR